jgi:hypothetical protein
MIALQAGRYRERLPKNFSACILIGMGMIGVSRLEKALQRKGLYRSS